jgi:hypothetical protein
LQGARERLDVKECNGVDGERPNACDDRSGLLFVRRRASQVAREQDFALLGGGKREDAELGQVEERVA